MMLLGLVRHMTKRDEPWIQGLGRLWDEVIVTLILRLGGGVSKGLSH